VSSTSTHMEKARKKVRNIHEILVKENPHT